jgi:hypothetical protein
MQESAELRDDIAAGLVGFQINPKMRDRTNRQKTLDLGFGLIDDAASRRGRARSLVSLIEETGAVLDGGQRAIVQNLPTIREARSKQDLLVLENKACMTAHAKAAPRLRNELEGAVDAINNSDLNTVAGGLVIVNASDTFISPVFRDNGYVEPNKRRVTQHVQPDDVLKAVLSLKNIPLRNASRATGYDSLGIVVINAANDGSPCRLVDEVRLGAPSPDDIWNYTKFIQQLAKIYRQRIRF